MSTNNKHKVSEKELDKLLGQAFLNLDFNNPKNQELMETISNQVLPAQSVNTGFINKALFTKLVVLAAIIATSAFIYFNYFKNNNTHSPIQNTVVVNATPSTTKQLIETPKKETTVINANTVPETIQETNTLTGSEPDPKPGPTVNESPKHQTPVIINVEEEKKVKPEDSSYVFPKLTEKQIKDNNREKLNMSMMLVKPNKYWYPLIGSKQTKPVYGNTNDTSAVFYMARSEVSNLEYRTFLFDLLIHDEKAAFLIAKPHQELWLNAPGNAKAKEMKDNYFSDKKYNDYPVVNITPEGAELYCKWLIKINKLEISQITARLPYENEWIKAAKCKDAAAVYPWPGDSIQNKLGCHLANFCIQKQSEKLRTNMICKPKNKMAYASAEFMLGDSMMTCKVSSYNPNDNGLYCMAGNVAEMVYDNKTKVVKTKGGSWNSDFEHCKIDRSEELNGPIKANPMTGFRPVFRIQLKDNFGAIVREDPTTGVATLNPSEIKYFEKQKKTMIESAVKLNKNNYAHIPMGSCQYKNEMVSVQSFYMQTTEVTNLEYRTFLADLLIQNRPTDYLLAKPDQQMWITKFPYSYNEPMKDMYFWHPAYDEYPVLNISREAALMYCDWLTIETNKVLKASGKPLMNDIRIPDEYEWALAASNGKNKVKYANGQESLKDSKGKYDVNYMCFSKEECRYDSVMNLYVPKKVVSKDKILRAAFTDDGAFHTNQTHSYNPNSYGLYGMAGNVSEMIINHKTHQPETKGGSWFSCDYFLEIDADDEYKGEIKASPLIGFRPVFTASK